MPLRRAFRGHSIRLGICVSPLLGLFLAPLSLVLGAVAPCHFFDELIDTGGLCLSDRHYGKQQC
ncbi:hypothetical protein [Variovorax atrisoli]|uniref:hypothetical protein n=1 Tax=Variovorax atrisoli TaxID=3394203 RepID=UPI003393FA15